MNNGPKPGIRSTEFWLTLIGTILPLLVSLGVLGAGDASTLGGALTKMVSAAFVFVANALVIVTYVKGRIDLKSKSGGDWPAAPVQPR